MKNISSVFIVIFSVLILTSCARKKGTCTGNVFYKYNNYVGNKPDAGAKILLYPKDSTERTIESMCDVSGNFKFENVPVGQYMLVAVSKETTCNCDEDLVKIFGTDVGKYFNIDFKKQLPALASQYEQNLKNPISAIDTNTYSSENPKLYRLSDCDSLMLSIPILNRLIHDVGTMKFGAISPKKYYKIIEIKANETTNEIVDFGISYN